jgi:hypothetical protein
VCGLVPVEVLVTPPWLDFSSKGGGEQIIARTLEVAITEGMEKRVVENIMEKVSHVAGRLPTYLAFGGSLML